jgi:hypothetical protein
MRTCEDGCNGCDECTDWDEPAGLTDPKGVRRLKANLAPEVVGARMRAAHPVRRQRGQVASRQRVGYPVVC